MEAGTRKVSKSFTCISLACKLQEVSQPGKAFEGGRLWVCVGAGRSLAKARFEGTTEGEECQVPRVPLRRY